MTQPQIDATRFVLRTLRLLDDGRRAAEASWQRLTGHPKGDAPPADRRRPPEVW
ncbi:MAG: hypothetical protein KKB93_12390 [Actinobacteria bacterium]|nr:hypothetical protein [Actinomycetota bacterium]MBU4207650.1 hypothetical protein [Actinomycetota bacterium]MBU4411110.1 hypothetical protein [Actinomycetota bacterium]MBU4417075.1 hypothetical protein [Actinomycetota bacterium]MBU4587700.1 hypothetical protein [Actinomycetota bacterium]